MEVYHASFRPLEWAVPQRGEDACYAKLLTLPAEGHRIVGLHVAGPHAGEIVQGFAVAIKMVSLANPNPNPNPNPKP